MRTVAVILIDNTSIAPNGPDVEAARCSASLGMLTRFHEALMQRSLPRSGESRG